MGITLNARGLTLAWCRSLRRRLPTPGRSCATRSCGTGGRRRGAVSANPNVTFVIDRDAVIRVGPFVALPRTAPMPDEIACLIEFENRWGGQTARRARRIRGGIDFLCFKRASSMNDPDVVLCICRHSDRVTQNPMVRERLRPQRVHLKHRRLNSGSFRYCAVLQHLLPDYQQGEQDNQHHANEQITFWFHASYLHFEDVSGVHIPGIVWFVYTCRR